MNWKNVNTENPICYQSGDWDGLKSDSILVMDVNDCYFIAVCYEGVIDGEKFFDWYDVNGYNIHVPISFWCEIDDPELPQMF